LGEFYGDLAVAERRHHELYLQLAEQAAQHLPADAPGLAERLQALSAVEADLVTRTDTQFRFHSGPPA
jgi:tRNA-(ms[2]io[6]A)-hydroxylase